MGLCTWAETLFFSFFSFLLLFVLAGMAGEMDAGRPVSELPRKCHREGVLI